MGGRIRPSVMEARTSRSSKPPAAAEPPAAVARGAGRRAGRSAERGAGRLLPPHRARQLRHADDRPAVRSTANTGRPAGLTATSPPWTCNPMGRPGVGDEAKESTFTPPTTAAGPSPPAESLASGQRRAHSQRPTVAWQARGVQAQRLGQHRLRAFHLAASQRRRQADVPLAPLHPQHVHRLRGILRGPSDDGIVNPRSHGRPGGFQRVVRRDGFHRGVRHGGTRGQEHGKNCNQKAGGPTRPAPTAERCVPPGRLPSDSKQTRHDESSVKPAAARCVSREGRLEKGPP